MNLFECCNEPIEEDVLGSEKSGDTYELDRNKAKAYAVNRGNTKPYWSQYLDIPDDMVAGFNCADFASQFLHDEGLYVFNHKHK